MANIGESLTTRLARERLQAIKNFIPVRDSVKQKLQARQQAKIKFTEGAEESFKPVTTVTEAVKTAIVGKPDSKDPDKQQLSLLQAIEGLKKEPKAVKRFNYKTDFTEDFLNDISAAPLDITNKDSIAAFGAEVARAYRTRELSLKNPNQNVGKDQFIDGVFKLKRNIDRLDKNSEVYKAYRTGVNLFDLKEKQEEVNIEIYF